ncbi:unnamed protein product [Penicillium nalgiovense]|nr:unnamed protein product [Penicillium nalgiovense]CAG8152288.1 unnamed protein product [Penicillium nalgiovense]CAG8172807.1 unnamed protein product [Penicillium nalgiovense]CAG8217203.1 unnamed protein product [Penicillium nalgiovense]CAG8219776.1 unnamed protein product [Penicillium nalgiovense]
MNYIKMPRTAEVITVKLIPTAIITLTSLKLERVYLKVKLKVKLKVRDSDTSFLYSFYRVL